MPHFDLSQSKTGVKKLIQYAPVLFTKGFFKTMMMSGGMPAITREFVTYCCLKQDCKTEHKHVRVVSQILNHYELYINSGPAKSLLQ